MIILYIYLEWASLENTYMGTLKYVFRSLRREKDVLIRYLFKIKEDFKKYLTRPDNKQDLVEDFQVKYNAFDNEYRYSFRETKFQ